MVVISVGQIGCGYWGRNLLRVFMQEQGCFVEMVAEVNQEQCTYIKHKFP